MTVSIIIAVKTWQKNLEECVNRCLKLDAKDFQIIILPDEPFRDSPQKTGTVPVSIIPTGSVSPADKRDIALKHATGEILAFIDDDAYPVEGWIKCALENFSDEEVAAVGGPAVTPANDSFLQKVSGAIYQSFLVSGNFSYRYIPGKKKQVDDFPSCNLLVRRSVMQELGGFDTKFWPGEDTKLCLDITKKLKKKIVYDPGVLVYHHRRKAYGGHLKQIANYALHRGYFVKIYPETSLKISYFIPSLFVLGVLGGGLIFLWFYPFKMLYFGGIFLYILLVFIFSISKDLRLILPVFFGIILTHFTYGAFFLKGLFTRKLKEEYEDSNFLSATSQP